MSEARDNRPGAAQPAPEAVPETPAPGPSVPKTTPKAAPKAASKAPAGPKTPRRRRPPPPPPPRRPLVAAVAAGVLALDQASKWLVVQHLDLPQLREIDVFDPWLNLRMAWNQGMNFGLLASSQDLTRWLLVAVAVVVCVWVCVWVLRGRPGRFARVAAGLLVGGALGNVIDRLVYGAVADFLNMSLPGWQNPYSFNIADIAVFAGAVGLVLQPQPGPAAPAGRKAAGRSAGARKGDAKPRDAGRKTR